MPDDEHGKPPIAGSSYSPPGPAANTPKPEYWATKGMTRLGPFPSIEVAAREVVYFHLPKARKRFAGYRQDDRPMVMSLARSMIKDHYWLIRFTNWADVDELIPLEDIR